MPLDRLDALLKRFSVVARMFHSGPLCGVTDHLAHGELGQLHLIKRGEVEVHYGGRPAERITEPSLIFYPRPLAHRFITDAQTGADMACANVEFNAGSHNPIARALPQVVLMRLAEVRDAEPILNTLFDEAFAQRCGRQHIVDRLFEVVLILILRTLIDQARVDDGVLAGMSHPGLARALVAMHEKPEQPWTLEELAQRAGMSRSHFAAMFREIVGATPGDYLAAHRVALAQELLRRGYALQLIADKVGYAGAASLSRAFRAYCGKSPREWLAARRAG